MPSMLQLPLPDDLKGVLTSRLASEDQLPRWALEAMVIEAYRERLISRGKLGELLGLAFHEREEFLAGRDVPYNYGPDELEADARTLDRLFGPIQP
jgi:predicted HTH domain antitoxin